MNSAMRQLVSAAAVAVGLGMAVAARPASAVTMYPDGANGPSMGTLGTVNPGGVNPWRGDWNHGGGYFPGQGGDLAYDRATGGGVTASTPNGEVNPWRGAWNTGGYYGGYGANVTGGTYAPASATLGTVNPGQVNPWRGAWNVGAGQGNGFWGPVDAAGAAAGAIVGAATAPLFGAYNNCQHLQPTYESSGNSIGQRWVNACD